MDTGGNEETPMDSTLSRVDTVEGEVLEEQLLSSKLNKVETGADEDEKRRESTPNSDPNDTNLLHEEETSAAQSPSMSSSSVFATPSTSLHAITTVSGTSPSPSSSVGELRKEESISPSTSSAMPSFPLPLPLSSAFSSLSATKSTISSPSTAISSNYATFSESAMDVPASRLEPFHPLPDLMTALNMRPVPQASKMEGTSSMAMDSSSGEGSSSDAFNKVESLGPGSKDVLIDKFKKGKLLISWFI